MTEDYYAKVKAEKAADDNTKRLRLLADDLEEANSQLDRARARITELESEVAEVRYQLARTERERDDARNANPTLGQMIDAQTDLAMVREELLHAQAEIARLQG